MAVPAQDGITRDNVTVRVDAVVYFRVVDPIKSTIKATSRLPPPLSRSFRLGFSGSAAGQGNRMSEALGIGRPQPLALGGGTVIAAMAALVADGFRDPAWGGHAWWHL
jgi:hypothetical protein